MIHYRGSIDSEKTLSFIQLRSYFDSNLEFQHDNIYETVPESQLEEIQEDHENFDIVKIDG